MKISMDAKTAKIFALLKEKYGSLDLGLPILSPVDMLIQTILSQNNNDARTGKTFKRLKKSHKSWEEVLGEGRNALEKEIRDNGLYRAKSAAIIAALSKMKTEFGALTLDPLKDMETRAARAWLESIKGVGPKTAGIVMAFSFNRASFPVDTHVHRVGTRLRIIPEGYSRVKAQQYLEDHVDAKTQSAFHTLLIDHGKTICTARNPKCRECALNKICPSKKLYSPNA